MLSDLIAARNAQHFEGGFIFSTQEREYIRRAIRMLALQEVVQAYHEYAPAHEYQAVREAIYGAQDFPG